MFNEELIKKAEKKCGSAWSGEANEKLIKKLEEDLNVVLPQSYKIFLSKYGEGGINGFYISGIYDESYAGAFKKTILYRESNKINKKWVVISVIKTSWENGLICIDTSEERNKECKIIKYDLEDGKVEEIYENFYDYFNYIVEYVYNK